MVEVDRDWEASVARVDDHVRARVRDRGERVGLQQRQPAPLPHEKQAP